MSFFAKLLNSLLTAAITGLAVMLAVRCYLQLVPSVAIGSIVAVGLFAALMLLSNRSNKKAARRNRESSLRSALLTLPPSQRRSFVFDAISVHIPCQTEEDSLTTVYEKRPVRIVDCLRYCAVTGDEVVSYAQRFIGDNVYLLCDSFDKGASDAAAICKLTLVPMPQVLMLLDRLHAYPKIPKLPKKKHQWMRVIKTALHPARFKGYLLTAFVLATTGFLTPYRIYYLVFAVLTCLLAAVSLADVFHARAHSTR